MTQPLQVTVGSTEGVNLRSLIAAIESTYQDAHGHPVRVHIGSGHTDGLTPGMLYLEPATVGAAPWVTS